MAASLDVYKSDVQNSALDVVRSFYEPYQSFSSVFITTRLLALMEIITGVPKRQFAKWPNRLSSFFFLLSSARLAQ